MESVVPDTTTGLPPGVSVFSVPVDFGLAMTTTPADDGSALTILPPMVVMGTNADAVGDSGLLLDESCPIVAVGA
jgi:hypothetical protein